MRYNELTEVKNVLNAAGIKFKEVRVDKARFIYVNGLMQIQKPTMDQKNQFWPEIRISSHEDDLGYYVKACGLIYNDVNMNTIMNLINEYI